MSGELPPRTLNSSQLCFLRTLVFPVGCGPRRGAGSCVCLQGPRMGRRFVGRRVADCLSGTFPGEWRVLERKGTAWTLKS